MEPPAIPKLHPILMHKAVRHGQQQFSLMLDCPERKVVATAAWVGPGGVPHEDSYRYGVERAVTEIAGLLAQHADPEVQARAEADRIATLEATDAD